MSTLPSSHDAPEAPLFADGLGERVVSADPATGELLQILRVRPGLASVPSFEFALRERAARLANFRHAYYARVRRIDRIQVPAPGLAIVSDHVEGTRLSEILRVAHETRLQLDTNAALCLIRQLVPAVALLHENARDVAHGLIAPERLVVTPHGRLVIAEHVLGAAIEQLQLPRERLWQELRVAMPPSAGLPRFDHRADVTGIGLVALALVLGRPIARDEFPHRIPALLNEARERTALGDEQPLSAPLRGWLARALQLDVRRAFASAPEAMTSLEELVGEESSYVAAPIALETFLSRYIAAVLEPPSIPAFEPDPAPGPAAFVHETSPVTAPAGVVSPPTPAPAPLAAPHVPPRPEAVAPPPADRQAGPAAPNAPAEPLLDAMSWPAAEPQGAARPEPPELSELLGPGFTFPVEPEEPAAPPRPAAEKRRQLPWMRIAAIVALVAAIGGGVLFASRFTGGTPAAPEMGTLIVQSNPAGVEVFVDGVARGTTPARLSVTPGAHILELRGRGVPRSIPFSIEPGAQVSQYLEFADTAPTGHLYIESQPAGARVSVDGVERGVAPLTVNDLEPGEHDVVLQTDGGTVRHRVVVQAGTTASLVAPLAAAAAGPVSGWVAVRSSVSVEIREDGRLLGTSDADRIMLAAGRHELELSNDTLGFRTTRVVQVPPGKLATVSVELPNGVVNLNATPWAEVWIGGKRIGETPIGNLSVPLGPHEIVFRHPEFGERRHAVSVTLGAPVRVSVDMRAR